jgi:hypothetical protein
MLRAVARERRHLCRRFVASVDESIAFIQLAGKDFGAPGEYA